MSIAGTTVERGWRLQLAGPGGGRVRRSPPTPHAAEKHESATFRLAVPRPGTDGADFIDIVTFDKLASTCAAWLTKGREVAVVGKLRLSEWTGEPLRGRQDRPHLGDHSPS